MRFLKLSSTESASWGLWLLAMVVYGITLHPDIGGGDSGEFSAVAYTWGIAHPPGYPLFTLLAKFFSWIPHGTVAWRINLLSAVCGAFAAQVLLRAVAKWTRSLSAGLVAGGLFAFSPLIWSFSTVAEVFSLNDLLLALLLLEAVNFKRGKGSLRWGAFVLGLGMSNHLSFVLVGIPVALWVFTAQPKKCIAAVGFFLLGLLPYLYLPLAASYSPWNSWGETDTWNGFWQHVLRKDYGTFQLASSHGSGTDGVHFSEAILFYLQGLFRETLGIGLLLGAWGVFTQVREEGKWSLSSVTVLSWGTCLLVLCGGANLPLETRLYRDIFSRFWQEPNLLVFIWIGLGFAAAERLFKRQSWAMGLAGAIVLFQVGINYASQDQHENWTLRNYSAALLEALPENSLLLPMGDLQTFPIRYLQECEGVRKDIRIVPRGFLKFPWMKRLVQAKNPELVLPGEFYSEKNENGSYNLKQLFDSNSMKFPIFISSLDPWDDQVSWTDHYTLKYFGVWQKVVAKNGIESGYVQGALSAIQKLSAALKDPVVEKFRLGTWEEVAWGDLWNARSHLAYQLVSSESPQVGLRLLEDLLQEMSGASSELKRDLNIGSLEFLSEKIRQVRSESLGGTGNK